MNDLIFNPSPRCACILVLDTSGSMNAKNSADTKLIEELNEGLNQFIEEVKEDELAQYSVEIGVVTAGPFVSKELDITPITSIGGIESFAASGRTPLGGAVALALEMLETRKRQYKENGTPYYRPWLVIISDGEPTDSWEEIARKSRTMEQEKKVVVLSVGVSSANLNKLSNFSVRPAKHLNNLKFREFFAWLSASMSRVSSSASSDSKISLPPTETWDSV